MAPLAAQGDQLSRIPGPGKGREKQEDGKSEGRSPGAVAGRLEILKHEILRDTRACALEKTVSADSRGVRIPCAALALPFAMQSNADPRKKPARNAF